MAVDTTNNLFMMTLAWTSKLVLHLLLIRSHRCVSGHLHSANEITEKDLGHRSRSQVFVVCFKNLGIILRTCVNTGVLLSLMLIDTSQFGQFFQLLDIDKLCQKLDEYYSGYVEKEELDILSWLQQELKIKVNQHHIHQNKLKY